MNEWEENKQEAETEGQLPISGSDAVQEAMDSQAREDAERAEESSARENWRRRKPDGWLRSTVRRCWRSRKTGKDAGRITTGRRRRPRRPAGR